MSNNDKEGLTPGQRARVVLKASAEVRPPHCMACEENYDVDDKIFISEHHSHGDDVALATWHFTCPRPDIVKPDGALKIMKLTEIEWVEDMGQWTVDMVPVVMTDD